MFKMRTAKVKTLTTGKKVKVVIDGKHVDVDGGKTILSAAKELGIDIPNLCHDDRLKPWGACRLCIVDVEGAKAPLVSCATKVQEGMVINTNTDEINNMRKVIMELLLSDHPFDCMICEKCGNCTLQDLAYKFGIREPRYPGEKHPEQEQGPNPMIKRDGSKCILCGRCVRICDEVQGVKAIDFVGRGFKTIVNTPFGLPLHETNCELCGQCVSTCPVGALTNTKPLGRPWEVRTADVICAYCGCGCELTLHIDKENRVLGASTKPGQGLNKGNTCIKGRFGNDFITHPDRLKTPLIKKKGKFEEATWDKAIDLIAKKFSKIRTEHGPDSIAVFGSAKCTVEENYIIQKFARAAIGTNNVDHCARLCHAPSVVALVKSFGDGAATGSMSDIENASAIFITGSNTTEAHPIIGLAVKNAVNNGAAVVVADPRKIPVVKHSQIWLRQRPGTDILLFNALCKVIIDEGLEDKKFIKERTEDFEKLKEYLKSFDMALAAKITGVNKDDIKIAARTLAKAGGICILYSMGITQHTCGTDNVFALANLAMLTGSIGRENVGVFPLRGQNNVQGSCDAGALPTAFPGYQNVVDDNVRYKFEKAWGVKLPSKPGKTVVEFMEMAHEGKIKAMYIMGENPMLSDPDINFEREAFQALDFLVVQDIFLTETAELADVVLPGSSFAEKTGSFVNTERLIQLTRKAIDNVGDSRQDWQIISDISSAMGYQMNYESQAEIMEEMASVTPIFAGVTHERLEKGSIQWPCKDKNDPGTPTLHKGQFSKGKGLFVSVGHISPAEEIDNEYPILLTTGRMLQHFHTGSMSRRSKSIDEIFPTGYIEISNQDAERLDIKNSEKIVVESRRGKIETYARVTQRVNKGVAFMAFHFWESPANALTNRALDRYAKTPEYKVCAIRISKKV